MCGSRQDEWRAPAPGRFETGREGGDHKARSGVRPEGQGDCLRRLPGALPPRSGRPLSSCQGPGVAGRGEQSARQGRRAVGPHNTPKLTPNFQRPRLGFQSPHRGAWWARASGWTVSRRKRGFSPGQRPGGLRTRAGEENVPAACGASPPVLLGRGRGRRGDTRVI